jgi:hypothetical protein
MISGCSRRLLSDAINSRSPSGEGRWPSEPWCLFPRRVQPSRQRISPGPLMGDSNSENNECNSWKERQAKILDSA